MGTTLVTGLPGGAKTLWTIQHVEELRKKTGREVYYIGIPELKLPWFELEDPLRWYELPESAIIVMDECQRVFPTRPSGRAVPEHVAAFELQRKSGHDLYLITQSPTFVDAHVRKLTERHVYLMRPFFLAYSAVFEWQYVVNDPTRDSHHKHAIKTRWKHPKEYFGLYKSANVHTGQKRLPGKVFLLPLGVAVVLLLFWAARSVLSGGSQDVSPTGVPGNAATPPLPARAVPRAPLDGFTVHLVGHIQVGDSHKHLLSLEKGATSFTVTGADMAALGYYVQPLAPCFARVGYGESIQYVTCRGRESDDHDRRFVVPARRERGVVGEGKAPLPFALPNL